MQWEKYQFGENYPFEGTALAIVKEMQPVQNCLDDADELLKS